MNYITPEQGAKLPTSKDDFTFVCNSVLKHPVTFVRDSLPRGIVIIGCGKTPCQPVILGLEDAGVLVPGNGVIDYSCYSSLIKRS